MFVYFICILLSTASILCKIYSHHNNEISLILSYSYISLNITHLPLISLLSIPYKTFYYHYPLIVCKNDYFRYYLLSILYFSSLFTYIISTILTSFIVKMTLHYFNARTVLDYDLEWDISIRYI